MTVPGRVSGLVLIAFALRDYEWSRDMRRYGEQEDELFEAGDLDGLVEIDLRTWVDGPQRNPQDVDPEVRARVGVGVGVMQRDSFEILLAAGEGLSDEDKVHPPIAGRLEEIRSHARSVGKPGRSRHPPNRGTHRRSDPGRGRGDSGGGRASAQLGSPAASRRHHRRFPPFSKPLKQK